METHPPESVQRCRYIEPINASTVGFDWGRRGFTCRQSKYPPGQARTFELSSNHLLMVTRGELEIELDSRRIEAKAGDEVLVPAGVRHVVRNVVNGETRWLHGIDG